MKCQAFAAVILIGTLSVTAGCREAPPETESPQLGSMPPSPYEGHTFSRTDSSQPGSGQELSDDLSLDFDSRTAPDRYSEEQRNPPASHGVGTGARDGEVSDRSLRGFGSTDVPAEIQFSNPPPPIQPSDISLTDSPDADGESSGEIGTRKESFE